MTRKRAETRAPQRSEGAGGFARAQEGATAARSEKVVGRMEPEGKQRTKRTYLGGATAKKTACNRGHPSHNGNAAARQRALSGGTETTMYEIMNKKDSAITDMGGMI